jgi:hypothetical protein
MQAAGIIPHALSAMSMVQGSLVQGSLVQGSLP